MRSWVRFMMGCALLMFGGIAATSAPPDAVEEGDCGDLGDVICSYDEETECTVWGLCPIGFQGYYLCCVRSRTERAYDYWFAVAR